MRSWASPDFPLACIHYTAAAKNQCPISSLGSGIEEYTHNLKAQRDSQIQKTDCQIGKKAKADNAKYWGEI